MTTATTQMAQLAQRLEHDVAGARAELTDFPSGGAMLDVRRDGRLYVLAFSPSHGYGVDEVGADDGFLTSYRYTYADFASAADQLRRLVSAPDTDGAPRSPVTLNLIVIHARDLETAKHFYEGLGLSFKLERHGSGPLHYAAEAGTVVFEIYPCLAEPEACTTRIGFRVPDVEETIGALRQQNVKVLSGPADSRWGRRAVVQDPDGNRVELTQSLQTD